MGNEWHIWHRCRDGLCALFMGRQVAGSRHGMWIGNGDDCASGKSPHAKVWNTPGNRGLTGARSPRWLGMRPGTTRPVAEQRELLGLGFEGRKQHGAHALTGYRASWRGVRPTRTSYGVGVGRLQLHA